MKKTRIIYAIAAFILLGMEVAIALFVHDDFVRPYIGDVLVVVLIHCAVRVVFPGRPKLLPVYVFAFACLVELTQHMRLLELLGLGHIVWLNVIVGGTFDWRDIACYAVGCAVVGALEWRPHIKHYYSPK